MKFQARSKQRIGNRSQGRRRAQGKRSKLTSARPTKISKTNATEKQTATILSQTKAAGKQYEESLKYLRKAAELHPADPEVHRRLAQVQADSVAGAHR
ncbi:MAG: hypothetical protein DMG27_13290 [Acidobacteria bacterium]|nr:MAG: hypothetical protein DMG27_13290 [Acidobacteriota bacterium]